MGKKVNQAYEDYQIEAHVYHRSYAERGLDILPTIHEGKAVTIEEKRREEEYRRRIANGEVANLEHTDVRSLNLAIREHNQEIMITHEVKTLRQKMERFLSPIRERIASIGEGLAEKLEHLRAEMIESKVKIRKAVGLKSEADQQIQMQRAYVSDLFLSRENRIGTLQAEKDNLYHHREESKLLSKRHRNEIEQKIKSLDGEIKLLLENQKYADQVMQEIERLQIVSDQTGQEIKKLQDRFEDRMIKYTSLMEMITPDQVETIQQERLVIREKVEKDYVETGGQQEFRREAEKFDREFSSEPTIGQERNIAKRRDMRYNI